MIHVHLWPWGLQQPLVLKWAQHQLLSLFPSEQQLPAWPGHQHESGKGFQWSWEHGDHQSYASGPEPAQSCEARGNPNIQAVHNQEKKQIKSLNKFSSFMDKVWSLEQQNKILETKWSLQQQQKMTHNNMDNMFKAYINNLQWELETLAQEKLRLGAEFGRMQGLVEDLKNKYEDEINKCTEMENEFFLIKKDADEAYMNKVELESTWKG